MKESNSAKILTPEEQHNLINGSYCHRYGILFRLPLLTGLKTNELLGLQWDDVDIYGRCLYIRHVLAAGSNGLGICFSRSPRYIPLQPDVFKDLLQWHEELAVPSKSILPHDRQCNSVAATITGYQIDPTTLDYFFQQIVQFCGIHNFTYSDLRNTFAVRFLEQGGSPETLSQTLGDPSVASIYVPFVTSCHANNTELADPSAAEQRSDHQEVTYPVVAKNCPTDSHSSMLPTFRRKRFLDLSLRMD